MIKLTRAKIVCLGWLPAQLVSAGRADAQRLQPLEIECPTNRIVWACGTTPVAVTFPAPRVTGDCASNAVVTCLPPSGSLFPLGVSTVLCTATNECRERTNCTFTITVMQDIVAPIITCPSNIVVRTCGTNPVPVSFPAPVVSDAQSGGVTVVCTPSSGSLFPIGTRTVTCVARDACGNQSSCQFDVTVTTDATPPVIHCPTNRVVQTCDRAGAIVNYPAPMVTDTDDPKPEINCVPPSGSLFPLGMTVVTCDVVDACTNRSRCTFTVTVTLADTNPPSIDCPNNVVVWTCETNGVAVNYPAPSVMDDQDRSPTVTCVPPSGSVFPVGMTMVTCTAEDECGNRTNCVFTVTVNRDTTPPQLECLEQITTFTCDPAGKNATYPFIDVSDNHDPNPTLICNPPAGALLPPGTNVVTCIAIDSCSNRTECTFNYVVVVDTIPPVVQCPSDIIVVSCDPGGVKVRWDVELAPDNTGFLFPIKCVPPSGSIFPIGVTKVTCTAEDNCGNRGQCMFTVTVRPDITLTNAPGIDTDGNGVGDIWEIHFNAQGLAPQEDADGDGMKNGDEARAGTDPFSALSLLAISGVKTTNSGAFNDNSISFVFEPLNPTYFDYQLECARSLGAIQLWAKLGEPVRGGRGPLVFQIPLEDTNAPAGERQQAFYRLVALEVDDDGDGLTAWEESILGTSDLSPNTHGDRGGDHGAAMNHALGNLTTSSRLREVALAHIGGTPEGPTQTKLVTAVGTGGAIQLSSWTVDLNTDDPVHLLDATPVAGFNTKLHVLTPPTSPSLTLNLLVHGRIGSEGNLWLTVYRIGESGAFNELSTLGYGVNASVRVLDFAMAHRPLFLSGILVEQFQLLTPIICTNTAGQLDVRVLSWTVHPNTGQLVATYDTGNLGHTEVPKDGGSLQCAHLRDGFFSFSYSTADNVLSSWFVEASAIGLVSQRGGAASGLDNLGKNAVVESATTFALGGLNPRGFVTALLGTNCQLNMITWEERVVACDGPCFSRAFRVTDNTQDKSPAANGVLLDLPKLTNSRDDTFAKNEEFGRALAVADFDGDGFADVAIGAPGQTDYSGQVDVMYGSATGLTGTSRDQRWRQGDNGLPGSPEYPDQFGWSLAAGDFNGDGFADLAIGAPFESVDDNTIPDAGAVHVLYGSANGLTTAGTQLWTQGAGGLVDTAADGDSFGRALAAGDFNGDGRADLAIGVPLENVNGVINAGAVQVLYGSAAGLSANAGPGNHLLYQGLGSLKGDLEINDWFGEQLVTGDFNADGRADLAVGIPFENFTGVENAGAVHVFYGSAGGLGGSDEFITQAGFLSSGDDIIGALEEFDEFGQELAAGDFNGDGRDDLAVGVSREGDESIDTYESGAVHILYGTADGLSAVSNQFITQSGIQPANANIIGVPESGDFFGGGLAAGDFDGDGWTDLAIGAPLEGLADGPAEGAGAVHILYGTIFGLTGAGNQLFHQDSEGIGETAEQGDHFGSVLAAGDLNGDGEVDLVVGVPVERLDDDKADPAVDAGLIHAIYGTSSGLSADGNQVWKQGIERRVRALLTDVRWEEDHGTYGGKLFEKMPANESTNVHAASVTKCMTLLLTVEALEAQNPAISLNDDVLISELAGTTGGSFMGDADGTENDNPLREGDIMPLRLLLHGMMIPSCNKSSVAIAEHVAGSFDAFVALMNDRKGLLGMTNTQYSHPAHGGVTTPHDLFLLWQEGWKHPLFRQIASSVLVFSDCGTASNGTQKCYFLNKGTPWYPGLEGWKGGSVGFSVPGFDVPFCTTCFLGQATRLDRPFIIGMQQTGDMSGDTSRMFDYGYRLHYTPDYRGGALLNVPNLTVADFTVRRVTDTLAVTAVIDKQNHLRLNTWQVVAGIGQIASLGATTVSVDNLAAGNRVIPTTLVDMTPSPTVESEMDYLTGHIEDGRLRLDVWRVAAEPGF